MTALTLPKWVWPVVIAVGAIFGLGWRLGAEEADKASRVTQVEAAVGSLNYRLCRIERALDISPYPTCP